MGRDRKMWPLIPGYSVTGAGGVWGAAEDWGGAGAPGRWRGGKVLRGRRVRVRPGEGLAREAVRGRRWTGREPDFLGVL